MPEIVETTVYSLAELSEAAKDAARDWLRESLLDDDWHETVFEDFERICDILGVTLSTTSVRLMGGGRRQKPCIWYSGFASQGDGACFEGHYAYASGAAAKMRDYAPQDAELDMIADALAGIQRRKFYRLHAEIRHSGHYCHEYSMAIAVERCSDAGQEMTGDAEDIVAAALRDLARWLYRQLEREYEYRLSDEVIDETIVANDYTFTETGRRFG